MRTQEAAPAMEGLWNLNLIHFLDFYFALVFFFSTLRRLSQYHSVVKLVFAWPGRWPQLLKLVSTYRTIFLTWRNFQTALLALALWVIQLIASRGLWPEAGNPPDGLTLGNLLAHWPALLVILPLALVMLIVDIYGLIGVGEINRAELDKYF